MITLRYTKPQVRDYGTLLELTADIDVHFTGAVSNLVMAAMSNPLGGLPSGEVLSGDGVSGSTGGGGGTVGGGAPDDGKLPFTGLVALVVAGIGSAFVMAGSAARSALRRRSDD